MTQRPKLSGLPPTFRTWLAIRLGDRGPVCSRWRDFPAFYLDVGPRPSWRHLVIRDDPFGDFSPTNAGWQAAKPFRSPRRRSTGG